ncbi:GPI-anchor biosynthetic protein (Mcd4), putative [Aspergillus udagawae]|nr:GPI-anchor biosynthetic protein (Mcd4), putative [Aspergillus udagawae]
MRKANHVGFVALSIVFHMTYLFSIFDMYFVDPFVRSSQTFRVEDHLGTVTPAKRLVLFIGDGVRADKAFQGFSRRSKNDNHASLWYATPFLRSRILFHGTYGISHTRIPSKTRPGHIAITAGVYEGISALTAEWSPLRGEVDTVFTRSHRSWMWGSPDIVPVLKGNTDHQRIYADTYSEALEDFATDATQLDTWVFEKVKAMFQRAKNDRNLELELKEDRSIFFLHLLGPDTTGHAYRPSSEEYLDNIRHVDNGIKEITRLIEEFFGDNQTAFVFTSDHGISDWGSHGDGNPDNTRTPLVAWGAGIAKPQLTRSPGTHGGRDLLSSGWALDHIQRHDVQQADVAALITYLLGSEFPASSLGRIPLPYLDARLEVKALAALANARAVLELYRTKEAAKKATKIWFSPKTYRSKNDFPGKQIARIQDLISAGKFEKAISMSRDVYSKTLESLDYLQSYDWLFLGTVLTTGYLSWILFVLSRVVDVHLQNPKPPSRSWIRVIVFCCILIGLFLVFRYECSSWRYYLYAIFPTFFWEQILAKRKSLANGINLLAPSWPKFPIREISGLEAAIVLCGLETSVCQSESWEIHSNISLG